MYELLMTKSSGAYREHFNLVLMASLSDHRKQLDENYVNNEIKSQYSI